MIRAIATIGILGLLCGGCSLWRAESPVLWQEGEAYVSGPNNEAEGIAAKAPASGGASLFGAVLGQEGGVARYEVDLDGDLPNARMLIRYSRYHWRKMQPGRVTVLLFTDHQVIRRQASFDDTGGWGAADSAEWGVATVNVGTMRKGEWIVKFVADRGPSDVNIDGFFLVPDGVEVTAAEMARADRIHIDGRRYVGVGVPSQLIFQEQFDRFELPVRTFEPLALGVRASVLDESGAEREVLIDAESVPLSGEARFVWVSAAPMRALDDGPYTLRVQWEGAPTLDLPVNLAGRLAATFEADFVQVDQFGQRLRASTDPGEVAYGTDFEHAVEFLADGWKKVLDGTADATLLANIRRTLSQYQAAAEDLRQGRPPYARRSGDLRLAFRSEATGRLEPYRLFIPDGYTPDGKTPAILALNHNENNFLDQADGVVKRIANERGYVIIAPGAVGTDEPTAEYTGDGEKDLAQLVALVTARFPGIDRDRLYGTGVSRGGFGTYSFAVAHPDLFAAIACVSGVGVWTRTDDGREMEPQFADVPTLILHGEIDSVVAPEVAKRTADRLAERNIPHELHVFPSHGHSYEKHAEQYFTMSLDFFERHGEPRPAPETQAEQPQVAPEAETDDEASDAADGDAADAPADTPEEAELEEAAPEEVEQQPAP